MKKLLERKLRLVLALWLGMAALASTASAAGLEPVVIYKVTTVSRYTDISEDRYDRHAEKQTYFMIVDRNANQYRTVKLYSGRKYRADDETLWFSQSLVSRDVANRERLVLSVEGPGLEWDVFDGVGSNRAALETVIGGLKRIRMTVFGASLEMLMPTVMKGAGRHEYANIARDLRSIETNKTTMRYSKRLTYLANSNGGGLFGSQSDVVDYLKERGWTDLFAQ